VPEYVRSAIRKHGSLVVIQVLVAMANTIANSFALIYLIREGNDYIACSVFILISATIPVLLVAFAAKTIVKNFTASMSTGLMSLFGYYFALALLHGWELILVPPLLFGTYVVTFWIPYNTLIMHITSERTRGATIGVYFLVWPLITTIGPLIGGVIITIYGYSVMFIVAMGVISSCLFYVSGFRVLRRLRERIIIPELLQSLRMKLVGKRRLDLDFEGVDRRLMYGLFAQGIQDGLFWVAVPIISFQFATSESKLSGYLSLFALWGAVMTVALGYLSDRIKNRKGILRVGALLSAGAMMLAAYASTTDAYLGAMSIATFWFAIVPSFLFTMLLDKLERFKQKGVLIREFLLNVGRVAGASLTIMILLFHLDLSTSLVIAGAATATIAVVK
jgi:MFS family permease